MLAHDENTPMFWPEDLRMRRDAIVRRGRGSPPKPKRLKNDEFWMAVYQSYQYRMSSMQWTLDRATGDCRRLMAAAIEALDGPGPVLDHSTPELEAVVRRIAPGPLDWKDRWIDFWIQGRGHLFAVDALLAAWHFSVEAPVQPGPAWLVRGSVNDEQVDQDFSDPAPALRLRALLAGADATTYQQCLEHADKVRSTAPFQIRAGIALIFPDQIAWIDESCHEALRVIERPIWHRNFMLELLACSSNLELALACALRMDLQTVARIADVLAGNFGGRILDLLLQIFATDDWAYKEDRAHVAKVLSMFGTNRVANAMMECLTSKRLRPAGQAWCERYPALARPSLEKLTTKKSKAASIAAEVLAIISDQGGP